MRYEMESVRGILSLAIKIFWLWGCDFQHLIFVKHLCDICFNPVSCRMEGQGLYSAGRE
jgi:hypothetical protein